MALGVKRAWPCVCGVAALFCPKHLAIIHFAWVRSLTGASGDSTPLFPTLAGELPPKALVVENFEAFAVLLGQPLKYHIGLRLFGGHTPRVTGAQLLAVLGVEVNKI